MSYINKSIKDNNGFISRNLTMKHMGLNDFKIVRNWCEKENWNLGLHDTSIYYKLDKKGHCLFFESKTPVSSISLVKYSNVFFTIGTFIVKEQYRKKGYGNATWKMALLRLDDYPSASVLLYAVEKQVGRYEKLGFKAQYINKRWNLNINNISPENHPHQCKKLTTELVKNISAYDKQIFPSSREKIFSELCKHRSVKGFVFKDDNTIKGYGIIRPCLTGYRIGPLISDSPEIAKNLIISLLLSIPGTEPVIIDMPDSNQHGDKLMKSFGAWREPQYDTTTMVKGEIPPELKDKASKNYGVFSLEVG